MSKPTNGHEAVFDDYCDALGLLTEFAVRPTLAERVQAALAERDRLQKRVDELIGHLDWLRWDEGSAVAIRKEMERLQAIVDRLPKDASGRHVIAHQDKLYHPNHDGGCGYYDGERAAFYCGCNDYDYYPVSECWPTKEAAEAARHRDRGS
jgi:hypothetical protein